MEIVQYAMMLDQIGLKQYKELIVFIFQYLVNLPFWIPAIPH